MKAVILAGGKGTRLQPVVNDTPKPLAPVHGVPFIFILMNFLTQNKISSAIVSTGYLAEQFETAFKDFYFKPQLIQESIPLGTGGAVRYVCEGLNSEESILVANGDTFFNFDLAGFIQRNKANTAMALREVDDISRYGTVQLDGQKITAFTEKRPVHEKGLIYAGYSIVKVKDILEILPQGASSLENDFFPIILQQNRLLGEVFSGQFIDIGIPEDYHRANTDFDFSTYLKKP